MNIREQALLDARIKRLNAEISAELGKKKSERQGLDRLYEHLNTVKNWRHGKI